MYVRVLLCGVRGTAAAACARVRARFYNYQRFSPRARAAGVCKEGKAWEQGHISDSHACVCPRARRPARARTLTPRSPQVCDM